MPVNPNSPESRDVAYLVHPNTNLRAHEENGPMIIERGEGVYVWRRAARRAPERAAPDESQARRGRPQHLECGW